MRILYLPNAYSQQRQFEKLVNIYPVLMAMEAEYYRRQGHEVEWGWGSGRYDKILDKPEGLPFLFLPHPDRLFTKAKEYTSGNYKYLPGTHILSASGCWHGKCIFCVENGQPYQIRSVEDVISEIEECKKLGFREIFDDSATFPQGGWLDEFLNKMPNGIVFSCNWRIGDFDFARLYFKGFRMLLFGVESFNQITLDKINKGIKIEDIIPIIKKASDAGLEPHIAVMFGYPWETYQEELNTLELVKWLLRKGYAKTAQASAYNGLDDKGLTRRIYEAAYYPDFWFHKIKDLHSWEDVKYLILGIKKGLSR